MTYFHDCTKHRVLAELRREKRNTGASWVRFPPRNFGYDVKIRPPTRLYRLEWRWGGRTAFRDGRVWKHFLGGKLRASVALGNLHFSGSNEQQDKEQEREQEKTTKDGKFKQRNPREKPRKKKKRKFQCRTP